MADKIYVGKGKVVGKYGQINIGFKLADLQDHANERGYVNIVISQMKEPDKYGNTHTSYINDWKPGAGKADGLPF